MDTLWSFDGETYEPDRDFDGETYEPDRDHSRLAAQQARVRAVMRDGQPHTLREISRMTGDPEASVSARIRDLRKRRHGGYTIERVYVDRGLFTYRMVDTEEEK